VSENLGEIMTGSNLTQALRSLRRDWRVSSLVILILAIAIGAAAVILSLIDTILLKPLDLASPERLVAIWDSVLSEGWDKQRTTGFNFGQWHERSQVFDKMAMVSFSTGALTSLERPEQVVGTLVTEDFFPLLGVPAFYGRTFQVEDFTPAAERTIVVNYPMWSTHLQADREAIGKVLLLDEQPYTVVGVMPRLLLPELAEPSGVWTFNLERPFYWIPRPPGPPDQSGIHGVLARLGPGETLESARIEMDRIAGQLAQDFPATNEKKKAAVIPLTEEAVGKIRRPLYLLAVAVALLVIVACANVVSLLLVRVMSRNRELAIRSAFGAGKADVVRMFLVESAVLVVIGNLLGLLLCIWGLRLIPHLAPRELPRLDQLSMDYRVVGVTILLSLLIVLISSLIPAGQIRWRDLESALRAGRSVAGGRRGARVHRALVAVEMMLVVVLLIGSTLLAQNFKRLQAVDLGLERGELLIVELSHTEQSYSAMPQLNDFYQQLLDGVRAIPGVAAAVAAYDHPLEANWLAGFRLEGVEPKLGERMGGLFRTVSVGYFESLDMEVLAGRDFNHGDHVAAPAVVVVNQALVRKHFGEQNPLGSHLFTPAAQWVWGPERPSSFTIVGVVDDSLSSEGKTPHPTFYLPLQQVPQRKVNVLIRTGVPALSVLPVFRELLHRIDPEQPIAAARTLYEVLRVQISKERFSTLLLTLFAGVALILALVDLWGVVSNSVREQRHEVAVRMAMGATGPRILRLMMVRSLRPALVGMGVGIAILLALRALLGGFLFGVSASDPATFAFVLLGLLGVAVLAVLPPTLRASRTDPMKIIREE
jgi:putative ABC transport system permease protein